MTSPQHHVLLIGIDAYSGDGSLTGCVNDIDAVQRLLIDRVGVAPTQITRLASPRWNTQHPTDVSEQLPTLANIRAALQRLDSDDVRPGDRVLIYYSGHGTQCIVDDGQQRFTREALLPKDKVVGAERRFLFDWELNRSIASIAARTPRTTVVLDCCSSGGATRAIAPAATMDRFWPTAEVHELTAGAGILNAPIRGLPVGRVEQCQVVAACREDQRARESVGDDGGSQGELTRALIRQLAKLSTEELTELHWGRIWRAVEAGVRDANPQQSPWLSGSFGRRVFGFGVDEDGDSGFATVQVPSGYELDVGQLHGVTVDAQIAIYGALPATFPPLGSVDDTNARQGLLRVVAATSSSCNAVAVAPFPLPDAPRGRLVAAGRDACLRVRLVPPEAGLAARLAASGLLEVVDDDYEVALVQRRDGAWVVTDDVHGAGDIDGEPVLAVIPANRLDVVRDVLEHYQAYITPLRIARACHDLPTLLRLSILDCNNRPVIDAATAQNPDLPLVPSGARAPYEASVGDRMCFVVDNAAEIALSVTLIDCAASGRVQLLGESRLPPRSRHAFWAAETLGMPFAVSLSDARPVGVDRLVAIGTTSSRASLRYLANPRSFADIISPTRSFGAPKGVAEPTPPPAQWTSAVTALRIAAR